MNKILQITFLWVIFTLECYAAQLASRTFRTDTVEKFKPKMVRNGI